MPVHEREPEQEQNAAPESSGLLVTAAAPGLTTQGGIVALQRTVGNAAVATALATGTRRQAAIMRQPVEHHTAVDINAMTLSDFNSFAERQADWHADTSIPREDANKFRTLLEFARHVEAGKKPILAGCGGMTVHELVTSTATPATRELLRRYGGAVAQVRPTVALEPVTRHPQGDRIRTRAGEARADTRRTDHPHDHQADRGKEPAPGPDRRGGRRLVRPLLHDLQADVAGRHRRRDHVLPRTQERGRRPGELSRPPPRRPQLPPLRESGARSADREQPGSHEVEAADPHPSLGARPQRRVPPRPEPHGGDHERGQPDADGARARSRSPRSRASSARSHTGTDRATRSAR